MLNHLGGATPADAPRRSGLTCIQSSWRVSALGTFSSRPDASSPPYPRARFPESDGHWFLAVGGARWQRQHHHRPDLHRNVMLLSSGRELQRWRHLRFYVQRGEHDDDSRGRQVRQLRGASRATSRDGVTASNDSGSPSCRLGDASAGGLRDDVTASLIRAWLLPNIGRPVSRPVLGRRPNSLS